MTRRFEAGDIAQIADLSIRALLDRRAEETPMRPFLIDAESGATLSYAEAHAHVRAVAAYLAGEGVRPGESVAYAMANGIETALAILGIFYGGYLATAINLVAGSEVLSYVLSHSGARLVLSDAAGGSLVEAAAENLEQKPIIARVDPLALSGPACPAPLGIDSGRDGLLMYTSGTTGRPKGVVLTHGNLIAGGANAALAHELTGEDRAFCVLPLYHINGLCVTLLGPLVSGGSVAVARRFSVSGFWRTAGGRGCTWLSLVPTQISYLLHEEAGQDFDRDAASAIRFARSASAPLSPDVQRAFEERFEIPVVETMGLTETAAQILSNPLPPGLRKIGSPGIAFGNEVMIADAAGREAVRGEEGEVRVRGANVMRLYRANEEATKAAITDEGWLCTGDLGRMDSDGYVFITGRLKELIIKGGENIAPREVDEALYGHGDVIEAAAFSCPCERYGERVEAGVVLREGSALREEDLIALCIARIGAFKAPDRVHILKELPKGPSGKIQRIRLAETLRKGSAG